MPPLFSVIIPTYNRAPLLGACIEAVLKQKFTDWELIVVDDGSTDNTEEVVFPYLQDKRCKYIKQENKGVSAARNKGAAIANGNYLLFLDSDDFVATNWLESFYATTRKSNVSIVCCKALLTDNKGRVDKIHFNSLYNRHDEKVFFLQYAGTFMINISLFRKFGGYLDNLKFGENSELLNRIIFYSDTKPVLVDDFLVTFNTSFSVYNRNAKFPQRLMNKSFELLINVNAEYWNHNQKDFVFLIRRYIVSEVVLGNFLKTLNIISLYFFQYPRGLFKYLILLFLFPFYRKYLLLKGFRK
jgi:glycosyltransferase involved in cell wall biosynthesis